jgi:hypothetical protein
MPTMPQMTVRLSAAQRKQLRQLSKKLSIDQTNVIRLAITRLAEAEGVLQVDRK